MYLTENIFPLKETKWIEAIFCLRQHLSPSHYVKFQSGHTHFLKLCLFKCIVFKVHLSNQTLKKKVNKPLKTIFYLPHYVSLLRKANIKINHAYCWKMCLLKCINLLENQHFQIFQHSDIRNETRGVNKNHFLSSTLCISVKVSQFKNWTHPLFKTVSAQTYCFI